MEYQYSTDWVTSKINIWERVLDISEPKKNILEVGSYEGRSTVWFINNLLDNNGNITCIDDWSWADTKSAFYNNTNIALVDNPKKKLTVISGDSKKELARLLVNDNKYNIAYIDGNNLPLNRVTDAFIAWQILEINGILMIDDYLSNSGKTKSVVDSLCNLLTGKFVYLYVGQQLIIKKINE